MKLWSQEHRVTHEGREYHRFALTGLHGGFIWQHKIIKLSGPELIEILEPRRSELEAAFQAAMSEVAA